MSGELIYLYGFVSQDAAAPPSDLIGVGGRPIDLVNVGDVQAVVSSVPADDFQESRVQERLHDLDWVGEQGALHERVVTWFVDHGGVLPVRLLTLYSSAQSLKGTVVGQTALLSEQLDRLRDLREWDLKVSFDARSLGEHLGEVSDQVARLDRELAEAAPGRRYLLERKRDALVSEETTRTARRLALELHDQLAASAQDARRLPLPSGKGDLPVVLNAAYLVALPREEEVRAAAARAGDRLGKIGVDVRLTGPWAPYRFLSDEAEADDSERET